MAEYRVVVPTLANCARCQIAKGTDGRVIPLTRQSKLPGATGEHNWIYHYYKVTPDGLLTCTKCEEQGEEHCPKTAKGSLSGAVTHLRNKHLIVATSKQYDELISKTAQDGETIEQTTPNTQQHFTVVQPYARTSQIYKKKLLAAVKWVYGDARPPAIVESENFNQMVQALDPRMPQLTRWKIIGAARTLVANKLQKLRAAVMASIDDGVPPSLTSDLWSDMQQQSYLSLTVHLLNRQFEMKEYSLGTIPFPQAHTAENIAATLKQQLSSILGDDDVGATWYPVVTTDSAADIRAALRSLDGWSWMKCCCHIIHNSVKEGYAAVADDTSVLQKCKQMVNYFKSSGKQALAFRRAQAAILHANADAQSAQASQALSSQLAQTGASLSQTPSSSEQQSNHQQAGNARVRHSARIQALLDAAEGEGDVEELIQPREVEASNSSPAALVTDELPEQLAEYEVCPVTKLLKLVNSNETRWNSVMAMIARILTLRTAIEKYQEEALRNPETRAQVMGWQLFPTDWEDLQLLLQLLTPWKNASISLEASIEPTAFKAGRVLLALLYKEPALRRHSEAEAALLSASAALIRDHFTEASKRKLVHFIDSPDHFLEWGIATYLDPRQKSLKLYKIIWQQAELDDPFSPQLTQVMERWASWELYVADVHKQVAEIVEQFTELQEDAPDVRSSGDQPSGSQHTAVGRPDQLLPISQGSQPKRRRIDNVFSEGEDDDDSEQGDAGIPECQMYKQLPQIGKPRTEKAMTNSDVLKWWALKAQHLPCMAKLARWTFSVQMSNASSERQFSRAGFINCKVRARQSPSTLWEATFLQHGDLMLGD